MRIGIDFDNTLVDYDRLFHQVACNRGLIDDNCITRKSAVRSYLRDQNRNDDWTELQGIVYGEEILRAPPFSGAFETISDLIVNNQIFLISHKTQFPVLGASTDLRVKARAWISHYDLKKHLPDANIYFEETRVAKVERISRLGCDLFVDDLMETFEEPAFPGHVRQILFDPHDEYPNRTGINRIRDWRSLGAIVASL
jgi:hypothetical protein